MFDRTCADMFHTKLINTNRTTFSRGERIDVVNGSTFEQNMSLLLMELEVNAHIN